MEAIALRPRRPTEIIDASVEVYRRNPGQFLLLTAVFQVPWLIFQIIFGGDGTTAEDAMVQGVILLGSATTFLFVTGLLVSMASELYLGRETDMLSTLRRVRGRLWAVFFGAIISGVAIVVSYALLIVPGVYVTALLFAVAPAIVIERQSMTKAFDRSAALSKGLKWHILTALFILLLIRIVMAIGVGILALLVTYPPLRYTLTAAVNVVILPFVAITQTLLYYDARIRLEGFDIEMMAASPTTPAPAAGV